MNKTTEQGKHLNNSSNSQKNKPNSKKLSKKKRKQLADKERKQNQKNSDNIDIIDEKNNINEINENSLNAPPTNEADEIELKKEKLENTNFEETISSSKHSKPKHEDNIPKHELEDDNKNNTKRNILLICIATLALLIIIISTVFALSNKDNPNIINGISISGIDVSGLSKEKAIERVNSVLSQKIKLELILKHNDYETSISAENFEGHFDVENAVNEAYQYGRSDNFLKNNFKILDLKFNKQNIKCNLSYNDEQLKKIISDTSMKLPDSVTIPSYYIDDNKLIITAGKDGVEIMYGLTVDKILDALYNTDNSSCTIELPVQSKNAEKINLDNIYKEIYKQPSNAYFTTNPYAIFPSTTGIDFNITMDEAKQIISNPAESYEIPLKVLYPEVTTSSLGNEAFPDTLATFSTTYSASNYNRSTNISLAASKINGTVLMPGETFSYNKAVGQRTTAAGFKSAPVYMAGQVVDGIGGGICQVSSTLYNAVLLANLDINERHNHGFLSGYVKAGTDATVSWGSLDFKFTNSRNYAIKIISSASNGRINISIIGLKADKEYKVEIVSNIIQTIYPKTVTEYSASLAKGVTKVSSSGSNGCRCETYRVLYLNGQEISRTLLSKDTYNAHNKVVIVGTKE